MKQPIFTKVLQVGFVVKNCEQTAQTYAKKYGIGPWAVYDASCINNIEQYGKPCSLKIKVACAFLGDVELELIEPLDGLSIYGQFLQEQGEGLHHLAFEHTGFQRTMEFFGQSDIPVLLSGEFGKGEDFVYMDTNRDLKCIVELYNNRENATYPKPVKTITTV